MLILIFLIFIILNNSRGGGRETRLLSGVVLLPSFRCSCPCILGGENTVLVKQWEQEGGSGREGVGAAGGSPDFCPA